MNREIVRLFGLSMILFAVLIGFTSYWTVFDAQGLDNDPANKRSQILERQHPRGLIRAADGTVLARSVAEGKGQNRVFSRVYPEGPLFAHAVGYSFVSQGSAGIERFRNDALIGKKNEFDTIFSELQDEQQEGEDVTTTLDPAAQRTAVEQLGDRRGSIVALEPSTGRVRVMASTPSYDPKVVPTKEFGRLNAQEGATPVLNRATQTNYQPGSTFKVVTAAAALDSKRFTPDSVVDGDSGKQVSGRPLANSGGADFGPISLTDALTNSVNTVWAEVGEKIGRKTLEEYMDRFGFNADPQLDYPEGQMRASGVRNSKQQLQDGDSGFDVGRVAIGQGGEEGQIQVTPLQMAEVAATVANKGKLMKPQLTERIVAKDGRVQQKFEPEQQSDVISEDSAAKLTEMMSNVVNDGGTGSAAAIQNIRVAGKTGTAEVQNAERNQVWFIGFAPVEDPKMAVAVTIEDQPSGAQGGTVAAPVAKAVLEELLNK